MTKEKEKEKEKEIIKHKAIKPTHNGPLWEESNFWSTNITSTLKEKKVISCRLLIGNLNIVHLNIKTTEALWVHDNIRKQANCCNTLEDTNTLLHGMKKYRWQILLFHTVAKILKWSRLVSNEKLSALSRDIFNQCLSYPEKKIIMKNSWISTMISFLSKSELILNLITVMH